MIAEVAPIEGVSSLVRVHRLVNRLKHEPPLPPKSVNARGESNHVRELVDVCAGIWAHEGFTAKNGLL